MPHLPISQIVVGSDFSACAVAALEYAISLAPTQLTLVHVCELAELGEEEQLAQARDRLDATIATYAARGIAIRGLLRTGKPWEKLHNAAAEVGAGLIVIGRVGAHGGRERGDGQPLGSVAEHVLRRASRPVLMVPAPTSITERS